MMRELSTVTYILTREQTQVLKYFLNFEGTINQNGGCCKEIRRQVAWATTKIREKSIKGKDVILDTDHETQSVHSHYAWIWKLKRVGRKKIDSFGEWGLILHQENQVCGFYVKSNLYSH